MFTETYRLAIWNITQSCIQPIPEASLQNITCQTQTDQATEICAQIQTRARDCHLRLVDSCGKGYKCSGRRNASSKAARANV